MRRPPRARHLGLRLPAGYTPPRQRPAPRLRLPRPRDKACPPRPLPFSRLRASCSLLAFRPLPLPRSPCFLLGVRGVRVETSRLQAAQGDRASLQRPLVEAALARLG